MLHTCDVVVLGMGTCGEDAALRLARAGLDVIGIEQHLIGGECPFYACLPTKSLLRSAGLIGEARRADGLVGRVTVEPDWSLVAARLRAEITGGWDDSGGVARFAANGGRFLRGRGAVTGPRTVTVAGSEVRARVGVVLATGSEPTIPAIPGLAGTAYWTSRDVVQAEVLPGSLAILGGGAVGCEIGQLFARFGVPVTIIEGRDRLLAGEEPEISAAVAEGLQADGVVVRTSARAVAVGSTGTGVEVGLEDGDVVTAERLLVAVGRRCDADRLGVAAGGASTRHGFVEVDGRLRAADGLWAIGDVTGVALQTHTALYQGRIAVEDVLGAEPAPADYSGVPRAVFSDPEVGAVGLTEKDARDRGLAVDVVVKRLPATFRGWLHRIGNEGVIKLVADRAEGRLVGASVAGPRATEVLGFLSLAVRSRVPLADLNDMVYGFPTFYGAVGEAIGSYGRGVVRVLDPETAPLFDDPQPTP